MPRFFVPESGPVRSEDMYCWIVRYVRAMLDCKIDPARIFSIEYTRDGRQLVATVGETDPRTGQLVLAILRSEGYLICTPYYGVRRGEPLRVAATDVSKIQYFDGLENAREHLRQAVDILDQPGNSLQSRLQSAAMALEQVSLEDFPAAMAADFFSLRFLLARTDSYDDAQARAAALATRALYVEVLRSAGKSDALANI